MKEQKIIFPCDHTINILKQEVRVFTLERGSGNVDEIIYVGSIPELRYVYNPIDKSSVFYVEDFDYKYLGDNKIEWIEGGESPLEGEEYIVEAQYNFRYTNDYSKTPDLCERCFGTGWYVGPVATTYRGVEYVTGINKLVQDYIKMLYTPVVSENYGTNILAISGQSVYSEDVYISSVAAEITSAGAKLQGIQSAAIASGEAIDPAEVLSEVIITESDYDKEEQSLYISIVLRSAAPDKTAAFNFKF